MSAEQEAAADAAALAESASRQAANQHRQQQWRLEQVPSGMVKLVPGRGHQLTVVLADTPDRSGSVGGWETSDRVLRPAASWFNGRPLGTLTLPCILDIDVPDGPSVEERLKRLYRMGHARHGNDPPPIRIYGDIPQPGRQEWRLDDIQLQDRFYRRDFPNRLRQQKLTLSLTELVTPDPVDDVDVRRTRRHGHRRRRTVTTHRGDTLRGIAVRQLGSSQAYRLIRQWNPKVKGVDPDEPLRGGIHLALH